MHNLSFAIVELSNTNSILSIRSPKTIVALFLFFFSNYGLVNQAAIANQSTKTLLLIVANANA